MIQVFKTFQSLLVICLAFLFTACMSGQKARLDTRDKMVSQTGFYCDYVSENDNKDIDIELNLRMANKCNINKDFSISGYKRVNESQGVMYCCSVKEGYSSASNGLKTDADTKDDAKESTATPVKK